MKFVFMAVLLASPLAFANDNEGADFETFGNNGKVTCYARNSDGQMFSAYGYGDTTDKKNRAMRACKAASSNPSSCQPAGCRQ